MTEMKFISDITVKKIQSMGGDHMVVAAAKVSTSGEAALEFSRESCGVHSPIYDDCVNCPHCQPYIKQTEANKGLINYLMKHRHGTPFEHSSITFFVHAPILVWREWQRHRIMSYNEESGRYKQLDPVFYVPPPTRPMLKVDSWKPGRPKFLRTDDGSFNEEEKQNNYVKYDKLCRNLIKSYELSYQMYEENLALGFDPGLARDCLPVGIYSSCWVTCNPRSLMHFLSLRVHDETAKFVSYPLWEIDLAARACEQCLKEGWPITYDAFVKNGRVAP